MSDEGNAMTDLTAVLREILLAPYDGDPGDESDREQKQREREEEWRREYRRQIAETGRGVAQYSDPAGGE